MMKFISLKPRNTYGLEENTMKTWLPVLLVVVACMLSGNAYAATEAAGAGLGYAGLGAGLAIGLAGLGGGLGQGNAARGMYEAVSRNPQAAGKLNAPFYVGMAFIESLVIFSFVIAYTLAVPS
jgi:F-type H+-transporting ATPase subunit c